MLGLSLFDPAPSGRFQAAVETIGKETACCVEGEANNV